MPQVIFASATIRGIQRLRELLRPKNADVVRRAGEEIQQSVRILGVQPRIGRPVEDLPDTYHEWLIDFGDSGDVARYCLDGDTVTILAVHHQKRGGLLTRIGDHGFGLNDQTEAKLMDVPYCFD